jgi:hypothetical protein
VLVGYNRMDLENIKLFVSYPRQNEHLRNIIRTTIEEMKKEDEESKYKSQW